MKRTIDIKKNKSSKKSIGAKSLILTLMICVTALLYAWPVFADLGDEATETPPATAIGVQGGAFEVTNYDFNAVVNKDHSYEVEEIITVNIPDQLQSIEFAIPSGNFRISDIQVEDVLYETKKASEASTVSITDTEKLSIGVHEYTIRYKIREYHDHDESKDMFYFNVLLPEWKQPIGSLDIKVSFPEDFPWDDMHCYSGQFGVQEKENKINFKSRKSKHSVRITGEMIPENFSITLKAQLPDGYWEKALDGSWSITAIMLIMAGLMLILFILWIIGGKDPKVRKTMVTKPIEGLSPIELGYVFNSEVRTRDVLHMLIQFAQKGYLTISEYEPKRYKLYRGKAPVGEERMYRNAFNILFEDVYKGRALGMDKIGPKVEKIRAAITHDVAAGFASGDSSAFTPVSRAFRIAGAVLWGIALGASCALSYYYDYQTANIIEAILVAAAGAAAAMVLCLAIDSRDSSSSSSRKYAEALGTLVYALPVIYTIFRVSKNTGKPYAMIPLAAASVAAGFFIVIMRARGKENAVLVSKIRRLRNFIYHPSAKELLENHLADSDYYYDMLIYALAFGAEEAWAISFLTLDVPEPEWYIDEIEGHAFTNLRVKPTTIDYARDLRSFIRTFESN